MTDTPKLDYWMLDVLRKAMRDYSRARRPFVSDESLRGTPAFKFTEFGKVELVRERLNEIQLHYDEEIKEGLNRGSD